MNPKNFKNYNDPDFSILERIRLSPADHAIINKADTCYKLTLGTLTASEPRSNEKALFTLIQIALNNGTRTFEII